ncbi:MAG TPA: heparan-alpha-glucosaminide N-acetyltransferase domain-containing protein [Bacteroidia bacterium]|nr:heparan-alpha-glucosaminide N-acetyltransferase domain-containing protein [Bacteroidia bacterium]
MQIEKTSRITSIDLLRGLIMVIMALDHSRDFLHFDAWTHDPLDFRYTTPILFLTRWVTHFCAPNFILLAGLSAYLYGLKKGGNELTKFLVTRGLWLILLELTLFKFLWTGTLFTMHFTALVIWAIGVSMVFLAFWRKLPYWFILASGLAIILFHNVADYFEPGTMGILNAVGLEQQSSPTSALGILWAFLHKVTPVTMGSLHVFVLYPLLPYFGLISLGYCLGKFYVPGYVAEARQRNLILIGTICIALFIVLRLFNTYGDPSPWTPYHNLWSGSANYVFSFLSFINVTKYPCSLLYILIMVGPALLFLAMFETANNAIARFFITIGKVPMFYYILHLIMFNLIALLLQRLNRFDTAHNHYHLATVYFAWIFVVAFLYPLCSWYAKYKAAHPEKWWLSYI